MSDASLGEFVVGDAARDPSDDIDALRDDFSYFEHLQQEINFNDEKNVGGEIDLRSEMMNVDSSSRWQLCPREDVGKILMVVKRFEVL